MTESMINQTVFFIHDCKTEKELLKKQEQLPKAYDKLDEKIKEAIETKLLELNEKSTHNI